MNITDVWKICKDPIGESDQEELQRIQEQVEKVLGGKLLPMLPFPLDDGEMIRVMAWGWSVGVALAKFPDGEVEPVDRAQELISDPEILAWMRQDLAKHEFVRLSEIEFWLIVQVANGMFVGRRL